MPRHIDDPAHATWFAANKANWNARVPIHAGPDGYGIEAFVADPDLLTDVVEFDCGYLGDVEGRSLLHLQCHLGTDTLSWAKLGANVTGLDFADEALAVARSMAADLGIDARFVESDVYAAPDALGEAFDIVYTGVGAINWLPDIARWARVVHACTKPGGTFYIREGHPVIWAMAWERGDDLLVIDLPYFETDEPATWVQTETYLGSGVVSHPTHHDWNHGLGEIITALIGVGFTIDLFEEHRFLEWKATSAMVERDGRWYMPEHQRDMVPLMYSIRATKPATDQ
jgi:SAM-dependent methyltransferase